MNKSSYSKHKIMLNFFSSYYDIVNKNNMYMAKLAVVPKLKKTVLKFAYK